MTIPNDFGPSERGETNPDDPVEVREREFLNAIAEADPESPLQIHTREREGVQVIALEGELDLYTNDQLRHAVVAALAAKPVGLVFDLTYLSYVDSSGLSILLRAARQMPGHVAVVSPKERIAKIFQLTGLAMQMSLVKTLPEALKLAKTGAPTGGAKGAPNGGGSSSAPG